ncbi:MAG: hypothetical protein J0H43_14410, partial [Actinobacteria bacterium]|nr:hypothetical protein [Actinomycetota bacterium]
MSDVQGDTITPAGPAPAGESTPRGRPGPRPRTDFGGPDGPAGRHAAPSESAPVVPAGPTHDEAQAIVSDALEQAALIVG